MEKNQKIILFAVAFSVLIIIIASIFISTRKTSTPKSSLSPITESKNSAIDVVKEEAAYKVENKEDAQKALEDINNLVESAGNSSF